MHCQQSSLQLIHDRLFHKVYVTHRHTTTHRLLLYRPYGVPLHALRKANNVFADHLLQGRRTVVIPGDYYKGGVSLSPRPIEGEEEELRKSKLRRFMNDYDLDGAVEAYKDDEKWEKEHPLQNNGKGKMTARTVGKRRYVGSS
ncbi:unnamed protein product [Aureobasidium pullulans]|nr:unnamed protein product [Aureobasidium pullulans]